MFKIKKALIVPPDFITNIPKNTPIVQYLPLPCNIVATFKSFFISVGIIKGKIAFIGGTLIPLILIEGAQKTRRMHI